MEGDCSLEILDFDSEEGKQVFWHSSAHILGEACEQHYGCHLCLGPPIDDGFIMKWELQKRAVVPEDYVPLEEAAKSIIDEDSLSKRSLLRRRVLETVQVQSLQSSSHYR